jgi:hypothetical protein
MKIPSYAAFLLFGIVSSAQAQSANVIISGEVKPGVYGRVEIGNRPPPVLVYPQPVVIVREARPVQPLYLHVPPGHAKKWDKHCHKYNACNRPVYFVKSREYDPDYRHDHEVARAKATPRATRNRDEFPSPSYLSPPAGTSCILRMQVCRR